MFGVNVTLNWEMSGKVRCRVVLVSLGFVAVCITQFALLVTHHFCCQTAAFYWSSNGCKWFAQNGADRALRIAVWFWWQARKFRFYNHFSISKYDLEIRGQPVPQCQSTMAVGLDLVVQTPQSSPPNEYFLFKSKIHTTDNLNLCTSGGSLDSVDCARGDLMFKNSMPGLKIWLIALKSLATQPKSKWIRL